MKVVIYVRYSSDNQREESIEAQTRAIKEYAAKNGMMIIKVYPDEAKSATTDQRPRFLEMMRDAEKGMFQAVIVHKLDRFSRDRFDSAYYKRHLNKHGVRLISVLENLDDSPESIILESVLEGMAEYYSKNLAREARKGMKENAYGCKHNGGLPPLGYDIDPETKKYIINEKEAEAVMLIFQQVMKGISYTALAEELNVRGNKTKIGRSFNKNSFTEILSNEKYKGTYIWDRSGAKQEGKRNNHKSKSEIEIIKIPGGVPAIVEEKVFEEVQKMRAARKYKGAANKARLIYLLSGKIFCGLCESPYVGDPGSTGKKLRQPTYKCSRRKREGDCDNKSIGKRAIEIYVIQEIKERILNDKIIPDLAARIIEQYTATKNSARSEIDGITNEINNTQKKTDNLITAIENGAVGLDLIGKKLRENKDRLIRLETLKTNLEQKLSLPAFINQEMIINYLENERKKALQPDSYKALADRYLDKVDIYPNEIQVILKFDLDRDMSGGGEGSRTPVRRHTHESISGRSQCIDIPFPGLPLAGYRLR